MESFVVNLDIDVCGSVGWQRSLPAPEPSASVSVVIDGCHNGLSMETFLAGLRESYPISMWDIWVLVGVGLDKNVDSMLSSISEWADRVIPVQSRHFRAMSTSPNAPNYCLVCFCCLEIIDSLSCHFQVSRRS
jgi:folylpolyglutamate synthase/dihydropteroate synthase